MLLDCAIIGGGPAGLNAALVLGRSRRKVMLFDDNNPRNAVTNESHGYLTRDGVKPGEFREMAQNEINKYPSVSTMKTKVAIIKKKKENFLVETYDGKNFLARKVILATGLKEILPNVDGIRDFYGNSVFSCPYCDGWEMKDKALAVISDNNNVYHMAKIVYNWSNNLIVCTNGNKTLTQEQKDIIQSKGIEIFEQKITDLVGDHGSLNRIKFEDGKEVVVEGCFITPEWIQSSSFGPTLGCKTNEMGGIMTDGFGRTNIEGVYAAGDTSIIVPSQLIIAAGEGSKAAIGVNTDLTNEDFSF